MRGKLTFFPVPTPLAAYKAVIDPELPPVKMREVCALLAEEKDMYGIFISHPALTLNTGDMEWRCFAPEIWRDAQFQKWEMILMSFRESIRYHHGNFKTCKRHYNDDKYKDIDFCLDHMTKPLNLWPKWWLTQGEI